MKAPLTSTLVKATFLLFATSLDPLGAIAPGLAPNAAAQPRADGSESARALRRFERLSANGSKDGARWYEAGKELLDTDQFEQSEKAFRMAASLGTRPGASTYNAACALARAGKVPQALDTLDAALEAGFDNPGLLEEDDDLDALRGDPRLARLKKKAEDLALSVSDIETGVSRLFLERAQERKAGAPA